MRFQKVWLKPHVYTSSFERWTNQKTSFLFCKESLTERLVSSLFGFDSVVHAMLVSQNIPGQIGDKLFSGKRK